MLFTITMASNAGTTVAASGSAEVNPYVKVGSLSQTYGFGWGTALWVEVNKFFHFKRGSSLMTLQELTDQVSVH